MINTFFQEWNGEWKKEGPCALIASVQTMITWPSRTMMNSHTQKIAQNALKIRVITSSLKGQVWSKPPLSLQISSQISLWKVRNVEGLKISNRSPCGGWHGPWRGFSRLAFQLFVFRSWGLSWGVVISKIRKSLRPWKAELKAVDYVLITGAI